VRNLERSTATFFGNERHLHQGVRILLRITYFLLLVIFLPLLLKAADVLPEFSEKYLAAAEKKYGAGAKNRMQEWSRLIAENRNKPEQEKLQLVNSFFNRVPYVSDQKHWRKKDYWATPAEMLASHGADCEDYAIAKYFTLVALGVDNSKLKITYVKAISEAHMVLTYYSQPNAIPLVLDNLIPHIKPASQRPDLKPVYAFNADGMWLVKSQTLGRIGDSGNIRFWREMKSRMGKEF
jgi:predicted transglutaminase-like cysteine proteinase